MGKVTRVRIRYGEVGRVLVEGMEIDSGHLWDEPGTGGCGNQDVI